MKTKHIVLLGAALTAACSAADSLAPVDAAASINGAWVQQFPMSIPGSSLGFTLHDSVGTVTGTGYFTGEAGPFGTLTITGTTVRDSVHLYVTFVYDTIFHALPASVATFDGRLETRDDLIGVMTRGGYPSTVHLLRAPTL